MNPAESNRTSLVSNRRALVFAVLEGLEAAWYQKALPTFADALAQVRRCLWRQLAFCTSEENTDHRKPPADLFAHFGELLAYAT